MDSVRVYLRETSKKAYLLGLTKLLEKANFQWKMKIKIWKSFKPVVKGSLGNKKHPNYKPFVADLLKIWQLLGGNMSIKIHFFHLYLNYSSENIGAASEDQEERLKK